MKIIMLIASDRFYSQDIKRNIIQNQKKDAVKYIKEAAYSSNDEAMLEYSKLCENDDEENKYLDMAAEAGNTEAQFAICIKKYRINNNNDEEDEFAPELELPNNAQDILDEEDSRDEEINEEIVARGTIFEELAGCNDIDIKQQKKKKKNEEVVPAFTKQFTEEVTSFFQQSSNIGDPEGHYQLALCYMNITGVKQDQEKAKEEFKTAADLVHSSCTLFLAEQRRRSNKIKIIQK